MRRIRFHVVLLCTALLLLGFLLPQQNLRRLSMERSANIERSSQTLSPSSLADTANATMQSAQTVVEEDSISVITSTTNNYTPVTAWCVLHGNNTSPYFKHFPHTMESLSKCWSYFCTIRDVRPDAECGLYVQAPLNWLTVSPWARELVQHMGCHVVTETPFDLSERLELHSRIPSWFARPSDAQLLTETVLQRSSNRRERPREEANIGIVQRKRKQQRPNRSFLNVKEIQAALHQAFPFATISIEDMDGWSMTRQARYWNDQDIIVTAHGAAMTNAIFMHNTSNSAVIEVYPDDYTPFMFQLMLQRCGGGVQHFTIQNDTSATPRYRNHPRNVDLAPNVTLIVDLVRTALNGR
jgi:hypothetical protein